METIADFKKWIGTIRSELGQQVIAVKRLAVAFNEVNIHLIRYDQVAKLRLLSLRVTKEVEEIKRMESASQYGANKGALFGAGAVFVFGSLYVAATRHKDAYKSGAKLAASVLSKDIPFGTILIAIGEKGIPEDVKAISVSRLARESNRSESEIEVSLKDNGYLLITPEHFTELLDKVESGVLDGSYSLPIGIDALSLLTA
ncbi:hypothetical protein ACFLWI_05900 [Chloroflexota bacterium]